MRFLPILAALVFTSACAATTPGNPVPISEVPPTPFDAYTAEVEGVFNRTVSDPDAMIRIAFEICTNIEPVDSKLRYQLAVHAFAEGAELRPDQSERLLKAAMLFACPDTYDRVRQYAE